MPDGFRKEDRLDQQTEAIGTSVVDAAYQVHLELGPGLLESTYELCSYHELLSRGHDVRRQVAMPVIYRGIRLETGYRLDLLVDGTVIVDAKAVREYEPIFGQQVRTYLKLSDLELGFVINFNVSFIKDGIVRVVRSRSRT